MVRGGECRVRSAEYGRKLPSPPAPFPAVGGSLRTMRGAEYGVQSTEYRVQSTQFGAWSGERLAVCRQWPETALTPCPFPGGRGEFAGGAGKRSGKCRGPSAEYRVQSTEYRVLAAAAGGRKLPSPPAHLPEVDGSLRTVRGAGTRVQSTERLAAAASGRQGLSLLSAVLRGRFSGRIAGRGRCAVAQRKSVGNCQGPDTGHTIRSAPPATMARAAGMRKPRRASTTSSSRTSPASNLPLPTNARHCDCFARSWANSDDRATGTSTGTDVRLLSKVARMAWHSTGPWNSNRPAKTHRS